MIDTLSSEDCIAVSAVRCCFLAQYYAVFKA